ncbi:MAG: tRNA (N6-threonylcarbamoyladenosine(37)-N6)-methyltransferase TrmO [Parasporobacterium sp.]|nr:tRNA (N6-threonylcarbamoyladenosine(37)-N6)-methyltransferase TrmO [Parasporobacterium sp.]
MNDLYTIKPIARIYTDFDERFGIPRQPGLIPELWARIVFEEEFRDINSVKGLELFSHLWLIWSFSETVIDMTASPVKWSPTVAPPRLGGKQKIGVFATRSPYRPNSLGLSSVKLVNLIPKSPEGPQIIVEGADILNGTPIFDIKPYVPYSDCHPGASSGYSVDTGKFLDVVFPDDLLKLIPAEKQKALFGVLEQDPRGSYEKQPGYVYGLCFAGYDIRFSVEGCTLTVSEVCQRDGDNYHNIK